MGVFRFLVHHHVTDATLFQFIGKRVPCAEIFPFPVVWNDSHRLRFLHHLVVKADLWQFLISEAYLLKSIVCEIALYDVNHISETESEYAAVPKCAICDKSFSCGDIRLFHKTLHFIYSVCFAMLLRYHITVFGGRIGGLYAHQYKISHIILHCFRHFRYSLKIALFRIRVAWHNNDCFILVAFRCFLQIGGSETDCGEGVPTARFGDDSHILTELIGDGILLEYTCSDCNRAGKSRFLDLSYDTLYHRFPASVRGRKQSEELFGAGFV